MLHGDDALTSLEVIEIGHSFTVQPGQQTAARPCRGQPTRRVGYARVTGSQTNLHRTVKALLDAGVEAANIHTDYGPHARSRHRDGLRQALGQAEAGDTLVLASLVTFARSQGELGHLLDSLQRRHIAVQIGHHKLADIAPADLSAMAAAITAQLLADIQADRAAARAAQVGRGAMPWALTGQETVEVIEAFDAGQPRRQIAARHGIGLSTVFRISN